MGVSEEDETAFLHADAAGVAEGLRAERAPPPKGGLGATAIGTDALRGRIGGWVTRSWSFRGPWLRLLETLVLWLWLWLL